MLKISKVLLGLVVASGIAFANPTSEFGEQSISKADSEFLFKNSVASNVLTLSSDEMKATDGEFWPIVWGLTFTYVSFANAPSYGGKVYKGRATRYRNW